MSDENNIGMGEKATVTATCLVLLCSKAIEEYREALREQEYDETGPLTIIPSDFEIARDVVVEFFKERRKTPEPEKNSGSAAVMREALNQLRDWALLDINENAIRSDEPNYKKLVDGIVEITNNALAAPARNCERFNNYADARAAFDGNLGAPEWEFGAWLFAPGAAR